MKSTALTIENEYGKYSVSAPIDVTFDEHISLFMTLMNLSGFHPKTVEDGIAEKADELNGGNLIIQVEKTDTGYSAYYKSDNGLVSSIGDTLTELFENLSDAASIAED